MNGATGGYHPDVQQSGRGLLGYVAISELERGCGGAEAAKMMAAIDRCGVRSGASVLDAGCGQGWHAAVLARRFRVTGVDANTALVDLARRRTATFPLPLHPRFVTGRLEQLPLAASTLDAAISLNTSIGYGTEEEDGLALEELARVLRPGAFLVLETVSATRAEGAADEARTLGPALLLSLPRFDAAGSRLHERQQLLRSGRPALGFSYSVRAYEPTELAGLARDAGFQGIRISGDTGGRTWRAEDPVVLTGRAP